MKVISNLCSTISLTVPIMSSRFLGFGTTANTINILLMGFMTAQHCSVAAIGNRLEKLIRYDFFDVYNGQLHIGTQLSQVFAEFVFDFTVCTKNISKQ